MSTGQQNTSFSLSPSVKTMPLFSGGMHPLADEGSFFVCTNATTGTSIATTTSVVDDAATASSTHAQASPVMMIVNQWASTDPNQKCIYPHYLRMMINQVPTSATVWRFAMRLDMNPSRITTAGTIISPYNINSNSGTVSKALIQFGAITTALPTNQARLVANGQIRSAIPIQYDQWLIQFGSFGVSHDIISSTGSPLNISVPVGPIIIAPQWSLSVEMWGASNAAAPSWEFEFGYTERPSGQ